MHAPPSVWLVFAVGIAALLGCDLFMHRGTRETSRKAAVTWSAIWIAAGLGFAAFVWVALGARAAHEYLAAYAIEKGLSLDNLFVFLVIFRSLDIAQRHQHTVLAWGVLGALVFRALFIFLGVAALERWEWVSWGLAAILAWAAVRALREDPSKERDSRTVRWLSRHLPVSEQVHGSAFVVREGGHTLGTRLLVSAIALELTDVVFAIDSVPAALSVSHHRFVVYSSNAFAILGLRSLYLVLAHPLSKMRYLHYGLSAVLGFAALKLLLADWLQIPALVSVVVIGVLIGGAVVASTAVSSHHREASA